MPRRNDPSCNGIIPTDESDRTLDQISRMAVGPAKRERSIPELRLRSALEVREGPMLPIIDHVHQGSRRPNVVPARNETAPPADGLWRVWETLRSWDQRFAILVDTTLAVGLFLVCSGWFVLAKVSPHGLWFVAGLTLPLILRRRAPIAVFFVIAVVALVQWTTTPTSLVADASLLAALYTVTTECDWLAVVVATLILEIGVILATARWTPVGNYFKSLIFLTGMVAASVLAGVVVRALRRQMGWLVERALRLEIERDQQSFLAAAAERARIAREMHDVVSHNIQVMVTLADAAAVAQRSDPRRATEAMADVSGTGRQALRDMRRLLGLLRDGETQTDPGSRIEGCTRPDVEDLAPQPGLNELDPLVGRVRSTGLAVALERSGEPFPLSDAAGLTVYRIVQEALTNTLKHAESPHTVKVALCFDEPDVRVLIVDDGQSSSSDDGNGLALTAKGGHGVVGMTERATAFDGILTAGPHPDGGWQVETTLRGCRAPILL
jgi:signal transduction histidine kinase